ncbi:hypothetical protein Tco_0020487 [Tanacetum coccineum]
MDTLKAVIHRVVNTYGVLRMKENELNALKKNGNHPVQALDDSLVVSKGSLIEPENNNAFSKSEIETHMQRQEEKVNMREAVDVGLVVTKSSGTKLDKQDTRDSAAAKPHQVNAPNYSRNSHKESYGSNDMVHAYFLEDARKMTQDKTRIPNHRDMASTRAHCTPNACTPKLRNTYRSSPVSKCSGGMSNGEPLVDHSRNSSFFLDSKKSVCSICHKYIFNTNHDDCITKILNKVNSRAKVQSPNQNINPVEPKNHTQKNQVLLTQVQEFKEFKSDEHASNDVCSHQFRPRSSTMDDVWTKQFKPRSSSNDVWTKQFKPRSSSNDVWTKQFKPRSSSNDVWTKQFKPRSSSNDVWTKQFKPRSSSNDVWTKQFKPRSSS